MNINHETVSIVTGGSSGIGLSISKELAKLQSKVYMFARNKDKLEKARKEIQSLPDVSENRVFWKSVDITNTQKFLDEIDAVYDKEKRLDVLVNNAGFFRPTNVDGDMDNPGDVFIEEKLMDVHFKAPFMAARHAIANYRENGLSVHNISSHIVLKYLPNNFGYGSAKAGLIEAMSEISKSLRKENIEGVHISAVFPSVVGTQGVIELMKEGVLDNPASPKSVALTSLYLIQKEKPYAYVGYDEDKGIVRRLYSDGKPLDFDNYISEDIIDESYNPKQLLKD